MNFIHEDPDFPELVSIVVEQQRSYRSLIEKDYWAMHALWTLQELGLEVWFKGGTSLSKGFGLIERFSDDLDLKIERGRSEMIPVVKNWKSDKPNAVSNRREYFLELARAVHVPGAEVKLHFNDEKCHSADLQVQPRTQFHAIADLATAVRLEVGNARVMPSLPCDLTSFIHDYLESEHLLVNYRDNRPRGLRCLHPQVTLLEKLDAIRRRMPKEAVPPSTFVRHFEYAAHIIIAEDRFPSIEGYANTRALAEEMFAAKQIARLPTAVDPAFAPADDPRWNAIRRAHEAIQSMFWGSRISIDDACATIRAWLDRSIGS